MPILFCCRGDASADLGVRLDFIVELSGTAVVGRLRTRSIWKRPWSRGRNVTQKQDHPKTLPPVAPLRVRDYPWGCIYQGTKPQIIGAGIVRFEAWPKFPTGQFTFECASEIAGSSRRIRIE